VKQKYLYLLALLSGLILSLAWPMHGFPFLLLFGFVPLFFIEDYFHNNKGQINKYAIFKYLYIAFFTWNILTTWWILNSTIFGAIMAILLNSFFMAIVFFINIKIADQALDNIYAEFNFSNLISTQQKLSKLKKEQ
jgi:apolipoprotein N-acyltransferase